MRDHHDRGGRHDHSSHHRMMIRDFRRRFFVSMGLTLPILALSPAVQGILGYTLSFPFSRDLLLALAASVSDFEAIKGRGVRGVADGQAIRAASPGFLEEEE
jgi:hypothetical protein